MELRLNDGSNKKKIPWYEKKIWVFIWLLILYPVGLYALWKNSELDKKAKIVLSVAFLFVFIIFMNDFKNNGNKSSPSNVINNSIEKPKVDTSDVVHYNEKNKNENELTVNRHNSINEIFVSFEAQEIFDGKQKVVVWVKNKSDGIFNGSLACVFRSNIDNSRLGSDVIFIENLAPKQKTYAVIMVKPSSSMILKSDWSSIKFTEMPKNHENGPYKLVLEKIDDDDGLMVPKIEFFHAKDKNFDLMYQFLKKRKIPKGILYHAVFVDDPVFAKTSKYPITAMTFEKEQSKHIVATYWYNPDNGNREFTYYEKNQWESAAKYRKD